MTLDFVEVGESVYALALAPYPLLNNGAPVDFLVNHPGEAIQISDHLNSLERAAAAAHAVSYAWRSLPPQPAASPIPFVGSVE